MKIENSKTQKSQIEIRPLASRISRELTLEEIKNIPVAGGVAAAATGSAGGQVSHGSDGWDGGVSVGLDW